MARHFLNFSVVTRIILSIYKVTRIVHNKDRPLKLAEFIFHSNEDRGQDEAILQGQARESPL